MNPTLLEKTHVFNVYDNIAQDFSHSRYHSWPRVKLFLESLDDASIVYDIGSGNGRHLLYANIIQIGCDTCLPLLQICKSKDKQVIAANILYLPYRDNSADYCTCIAVLHHLSTKERRIEAIKEIVRVMKKNGQCLIYVWAMEQNLNGKKSKYLKKNPSSPSSSKYNNGDYILPVHCSGTEFKHQDLLVPWLNKNSKIQSDHLRYYHVFRNGELEELLRSIDNLQIVESFYEEGNWCVIFTKL